MSSPVDISNLPAEMQKNILEHYLGKGKLYALEYDLQSHQAPVVLHHADEVTQRHFYRDNEFTLPIFYSLFDWPPEANSPPASAAQPDHNQARVFNPSDAKGMKLIALESIETLWLTDPSFETVQRQVSDNSTRGFVRLRIPDGSPFVRPEGELRSNPPPFRLADLNAFTSLKTISFRAFRFSFVFRLVFHELRYVTRPITLSVHLSKWLDLPVSSDDIPPHETHLTISSLQSQEQFQRVFNLPNGCGHKLELVFDDRFLPGIAKEEKLAASLVTSLLRSVENIPRLNSQQWDRAGKVLGQDLLRQHQLAETQAGD